MAATALIVGASRGLGLGLAAEYRRRGWHVIGTVRGTSTGLHDLAAQGGVEIETLDTTSEAGIDALAVRLAARTIDLLFVNAGVALAVETPLGRVDEADFARIMLVNAFAPLRIIERLSCLVSPRGTVAVMSSELGSIAGATGGWEIYRMSKAALNMGLKSVASRLTGQGRTFLCVAPGWVRTDMGGPAATFSVEESTAGIADTVAARQGKGGVAFVSHTGRDLPW